MPKYRCPECGHERGERSFDRIAPPPCSVCCLDEHGRVKLDKVVRMEIVDEEES